MVQNPYNRLKVPPNHIYFLEILYQFCDNFEILSFTYHLKEAEIKITYDFRDTLKRT